MRILALTPTPDRPEAEILAGLARGGASVHVVGIPAPLQRDLLTRAGATITEYVFRSRLDLRGMRLIRAIVRREKIDIVYALTNRALSTAVIGLTGLSPKLVAYRGTVGHLSWLDPSCWFTYLNPRVRMTLCVSQAVEEYMLSKGISRDRLALVYKGHDVTWYQSAEVSRAEFGVPDSAFVVGCTAVMRAVKGIDDLLAATTMLLDEIPNLHLLLIGSVKDPEIQTHIDAFPRKDRLHVLGFRDDATRLQRLADVAVMASKSREGFPKSIIEAMAQGVPTIVTTVGGMPELVGHGAAGVMVEPMNPISLADGIRTLHHNPQFRKSLGNAARDRIIETFNINQSIAQVNNIFAALCAEDHNSRS
jgi:glycosyltransferase involved in cell wall biosynthesis